MRTLRWQPPYDWAWMWGFLGARAVAGIETLSEGRYTRSFALDGHRGVLTLTPDETTRTLAVSLSPGLQPVAEACLLRVEQLLDLRCDPLVIAGALGSLAAARPGLRLPGCMDPFEQGIRAILGQLVSVAMAARLTAKVVATFGDPLEDAAGYFCFPRPARLADADPMVLKALGMPLKRAEAIIHFAKATLNGELARVAPADTDQAVRNLMTWPGIGRWTANYFALRGWQAKDVFLPDDYLIKQRFPGMTPAQIRHYAARWQPWRSYALLHIWYSDGWQPEG